MYYRNILGDVLAVGCNLTGYRVVVGLAPYRADEDLTARLSAYAASDGVLIVTALTGSTGASNHWRSARSTWCCRTAAVTSTM